MTDETIQLSNEVKIKQYRNLLILSGLLVMVILVIYYLMDHESSSNSTRKKDESASFSSPIDQVNTQSVWMERAQNKLKEQETQTAELKTEVTELKRSNSLSLESDPRFLELQKQVQLMQAALKSKSEVQKEPVLGTSAYNGQVFSTIPGAQINASDVRKIQREEGGIDNDQFKLKHSSYLPEKNPNTFVPAGTFAQAIMLGAADASAGVQAQVNPSPMLFRITADGTLPNHRKSHLKDCVVTAAVIGDISSERGFIRLERLSCTFPNGEVVEQQVEGTIFGMDAKHGVRGNPVWRESALVQRATVAGTLSGLGNALSQSYTTNSISPLGSTNTVNNREIFKYGAAQGSANGLEKLADYNIRRAEQYHPVIQLSAGQPVDIVFLKGFYLDGRKHEANQEESPQPHRLFPGQSRFGTSELGELNPQGQGKQDWLLTAQTGGM